MNEQTAADLFPDLGAEQAHLARARRARVDTIESLHETLRSTSAADEITQEYIEVTATRALESLADPGVAEFFGRIDESGVDRWYIGRRHLEDQGRTPVVVDWRAAIAAPFYRATVRDNQGLVLRRRFSIVDGEVVSYNDEHLDDPDQAEVAGGIPDPVLAEIGAARTGAMREIVATIQGEQDVVIRTPMDTCLVVQGGPGTGKTAVGLHRAAYLLFDHRARLEREGVLVVGPNRVFLEYIAKVLPSLGERSVTQRTIADLLMPRITIAAIDQPETAALKGDVRLAAVIERAARALLVAPKETIRFGVGSKTVVVTPDDIAGWVEAALGGSSPWKVRRSGLRGLVRQELERRTGKTDVLTNAPTLRKALDTAWPAIKPTELVGRLLQRNDVLAAAADGILTADEQSLLRDPARAIDGSSSGKRRAMAARAWTVADAVLLDEAYGLIEGVPFAYGHVVVDEAQDLSAMGLRAIARRSPSRSLTVLGDLAQATEPGGQRDWDEAIAALGATGRSTLAELTVGYRVPGPILELANRVLLGAEVSVTPSRAARVDGDAPLEIEVAADRLGRAVVDQVVALRARHPQTGVIAAASRVPEIIAALAADGLRGVLRLQGLEPDEVPVLPAESAKGLELDGVVLVDPDGISAGTARGTRLLYIAITRAVQHLTIVRPALAPA
jgi:DNA helicase IV